MNLLDDPALILVSAAPPAREPGRSTVVRFLPSSAFASDFRLPPGAEGIIRGRYDQHGAAKLNVWIEGVGMAFGVPRDEVETVENRTLEPEV